MKKTSKTEAKKEPTKGKSKGKKAIEIDMKTAANKLGGKNFFILNQYTFQHLDSNNNGQIFYNNEDRGMNQKWNFINTDVGTDVYSIKNYITSMYLSSDSKGELFAVNNIETADNYSRWKIYKTTELDIYIISNFGNNFYLDSNKTNQLFLNYQTVVAPSSLFYVYLKKPKK